MTQFTRVAAYAILVQEGHILLCRLSKLEAHVGKWTLPGGGIEFGEHPEEAAVREVREETGYDIQIGGILEVDSEAFVFGDRHMHAIRVIYSGEIMGGQLTDELDGTTDLAAWIPLNEVDELPTVPLAKLGIHLAKDALTK